MNVPDDIISKLALSALRELDAETGQFVANLIPNFTKIDLPPNSVKLIDFKDDVPEKAIPVLEYVASRNLYLEDYPLYWSSDKKFENRLIIPFYYENMPVGYTARAVDNTIPRYVASHANGFVFNVDRQRNNRNFVCVCEGPFDAISIDGCALLGSEIRDQQNYILKQLDKELVLIPDKDKDGQQSISKAIELGWSVSMPDWPVGIKDVNDAVKRLGRIATLWLIASAKESSSLKIQLKAKRWFKNDQDNE